MCVFVNFVFANTVFMHAHQLYDGRTVTHSHPYLPSSAHGHTADALALISQLNLAAASMEGSSALSIDSMPEPWSKVVCLCVDLCAEAVVGVAALRGPPAIG